MTAASFAQQAYKNSQRELASEKSIELQVFYQITSRMRAADISETGGMSKLAEALTDNMKLWNILFSDLSLASNKMPDELKAQIMSLAKFTQSQTFEILAGRAKHDVLIDINQAMMNGMRAGSKVDMITQETKVA
ncbi:MAG: flagellar biosynthesis regulator FlaF [Maricaulaceae bacterium]